MKQNTEKMTTVEGVELMEVNAIDTGPASLPEGAGIVATDRYLDVVKDVEIRVSASLGSADLTVGELFSLTQGSVIKLDKDSTAPIELTLNGQLVARGSLVVVDDNFGIQLTEMAQL